MFQFVLSLIRLSAKPATIIYPYPIVALLAFSFSGFHNVVYLLEAIIFSFLFYSGVNLWNHLNDIKEDLKGGKRTILTENPELQYKLSIIPIFLYMISFALVFFWTVDVRGIAFFAIAASVTWLYSDRIYFGKKISRWKDYYLTELLAFIIFFPSFFIMLWTIFSPISPIGLGFSITLSFFMLSGALLKDIRDITGDRLAGLKTLGVVFSTKSLLKWSFFMLILYYSSILILSLILDLFPRLSAISVVFFFGFAYTISHFYFEEWNITRKSIKPLEVLYYSNLGSLITLILSGII